MKSFTSKKTLVSCIYGCLHWRSQGNFNEKKFDENDEKPANLVGNNPL